MVRIKSDEIRGYCFESVGGNVEYVCLDCATKEDLKDLEQHEILMDKDVEGDDMIFCDRCQERIE